MIKTFSTNNHRSFEQNVKTLLPHYLENSNKKPTIEEYRLLARLYQDNNLNNKSIYYFKKVLDANINTFGIEHRKTANSYIDLADAYAKDSNFYDEVLLAYQTALAIQKKLFGAESVECAVIYSALGNFFFLNERMNKPLKFYKQALRIRKDKLGVMHPLTAKSAYELGYFYASLEEYEFALPLFQQSLDVRVELFRMSHPETAKSYNSLGMCYYHLFEYEKAEFYLAKAVKIKALILPKNDEYFIRCKQNLKEIRKYLSFSLSKRVTNFFNSL